MDEKITSLRTDIDDLNLQILALLSERAKKASEIGALQSAAGGSQYDPMREQAMLKALVAANTGPFNDATVKALFKSIFQASMQHSVQQEQSQYLVSRSRKSQGSVIQIGETKVGTGQPPALIAGPCAVESREQMEVVAQHLSKHGVKLFRGGAFKPRTDPYSFQGLGVEGLKLSREVSDQYGLSFVSEIMDAKDLPAFEEYADVLQIGARNMQNFTLLKAVGRSSKPVILKRGLSATIEEWLMAAEYLLHEGNENVILCERGIRTYETYTRNTLDVSAVALAKLETHLPVIVDVTHSGGRRDLLVALTKAGLAAGADGIMVEVHPNPAVALSDQKQQIDFDQFDEYLNATGYHRALSKGRSELYGL